MAEANVRDFGAKADGNSHPLSEQYATLEEAQIRFPFVTSLSRQIDACALQLAMNTGIRRVICPEGVYIMDELTPVSSVQIVGDGIGKTIFKLKNEYNKYMAIALRPVHDFSINDLTIDGNKANNSTPTPLVEFRKSYNMTFQRIRFTGSNDYFLVNLDGCRPEDDSIPYMNIFRECIFDDFHTAGIMNTVLNSGVAKAGGNLFIDRCVFRMSHNVNGSAGVFSQKGGDHINVVACQFEKMADSATIITGGENVTIENCSGHTFGASMWFGTNGEEPRMKNIHVNGNSFLSDTDTPLGISNVDGFIVEGNHLSDSGLEGIFLIRSNYGTISGNIIKNNGNFINASGWNRANGITITDSGTMNDECHDVMIDDNLITDDRVTGSKIQEYGINFISFGRDITLQGNRLKGNKFGRIKTIAGRHQNIFIINNEDMNYKLSGPGWDFTVDWGEAKIQGITLYNNVGGGLVFSHGVRGEEYILQIIQDATGGRTISTWGSNIKFPGGIKPVLTTKANKCDVLKFMFDGTNYFLVSITQNM